METGIAVLPLGNRALFLLAFIRKDSPERLEACIAWWPPNLQLTPHIRYALVSSQLNQSVICLIFSRKNALFTENLIFTWCLCQFILLLFLTLTQHPTSGTTEFPVNTILLWITVSTFRDRLTKREINKMLSLSYSILGFWLEEKSSMVKSPGCYCFYKLCSLWPLLRLKCSKNSILKERIKTSSDILQTIVLILYCLILHYNGLRLYRDELNA